MTTPTEGKEVVLLGAGFSRNVNNAMPLERCLGKMVSEYISNNSQSTGVVTLPSVVEKGRRGAEYAAVTRALVEVLQEAQISTLKNPLPRWLEEFVVLMHRRQTTLVTLNNDTLFETALESAGVPTESGSVTANSCFGGLPPTAESSNANTYQNLRVNGQNISSTPAVSNSVNTLKLLKLHGSLDWYWVPGDLTGTSLLRYPILTHFGQPTPDDNSEDRRSAIPGREPFVVPPLMAKSRFFTNAVMRQLWQDAASALSKATRIVIIGYSLPEGDLAIRSLLADTLAEKDVDVVVVDPNSKDIVCRLKKLGLMNVSAFEPTGDNVLNDFVDRERDSATVAFARDLACRPQNELIDNHVRISIMCPGYKRSSNSVNNRCTSWIVQGAVWTQGDHTIRLQVDESVSQLLNPIKFSLAQLYEKLNSASENGGGFQLVVQTKSGKRVPVIGGDLEQLKYEPYRHPHGLDLLASHCCVTHDSST
ncbi:hypothetical protein [Acidithrix ferrooxidans]|uniref:SIR2-like domain-containing protein n=1 Tax=Acidithrix ferrooxidans TaxID=1280514 RepID=A0A0D8HLT8_9ACTN|nr:hypothetical protein [Acidithrix ferrooxidans]KJF18061.1 hypothetical protein AXFE_11600 [Acidithrix ferrooxidans]